MMVCTDASIVVSPSNLQRGAVVSIRVASSTPAYPSVPVVAATGTVWSRGSTPIVSGKT